MSTVNPLAREISAKIVYYGPGLSGKTTSLQQLHAGVRPESRGQLISLSTEGDRTLFFDFLPLKVEQVRGLNVRLQLYTVPGQVFYDATRKLVLNGADGVVFVADSQRAALDSNLESMSNLETNLGEMGIDLSSFPFVVQYNKRDLPGVMPVAELREALNPLGVPEFETIASRGHGVLPALKEVTRLVLRDLNARKPGRPEPPRAWVLSGGGSELATQISAAAEAPRAGPAPAEPAAAAASAHTPPPARSSAAARAGMPSASVAAAARRDAALAAAAAPRDRAQLVALSFARLFPGEGGAVAEVELEIRERAFGPAVRRAAEAITDLLAAFPVDEQAPAARAALLGLDGREFLRLGRLAARPDPALTEQDALFALYLLVAAMVKAERI